MRRVPIASAILLSALCADAQFTQAPLARSSVVPSPLVPINDLGATRYKGQQGGLYAAGSNDMSAAHRAVGITRANLVQPLDTNGNPDANGKIVFLAIGMSNTTQEFCFNTGSGCATGTFKAQAAADATVDTSKLVIVDGSQAFVTADQWDNSADTAFDTVRDVRLAASSVTEAQVQIVWAKHARATPNVNLPSASADAYSLETNLGNGMRAIKTRYPNIQIVFISSRSYGGYATGTLNPEPYAYETGFGVKWVIDAQIVQMNGGGTDSQSGDLNYSNGTAPWISWGPYLWANGTTQRYDGLSYASSDYQTDGTHPSQAGRTTIAGLLLTFLKASPFSKCWFLAAHPACE